MDPSITPSMPNALPIKPHSRKCPEVPVLPSYSENPSPDFWKSFPREGMPRDISSQVDRHALSGLVARHSKNWTHHSKAKAAQAIKAQEEGAEAFQVKPLPPACVRNAKSAATHGMMVTDTLASWVKAGIVKGPFSTPPVPFFRANSIMAVDQKDKVRLVLDMSRPEGRSFNDNLDKVKLPRVTMATAKQFSYLIREAGRHAVMNKDDMKDAYKLVPAKKEDWRLQGMAWLGKFFLETQLVFGESSAVPNYDSLAGTIQELALSISGMPRRWALRTLDDMTVVSPAGTGMSETYRNAYHNICSEVNIPLASPCPAREKAFSCQTSGRILGTWFDTDTLSWSYPEDKMVPMVRDLLETMDMATCDLRHLQSIMGLINDVSQLCPFLKGFRKPLLVFLASFEDREDVTLAIPPQAKADLLTCTKIVMAAGAGLPLAARPTAPALNAIRFTSDAAGAIMATQDGRKVTVPSSKAIGAASICMDSRDNPSFACRITWPIEFLNQARDSKGSLFGAKSTCLETIGAILPFLAAPQLVAGRHVVLELDNIAVLFAWEKRQAKDDLEASMFIRALHLITSFLACQVHIQHLPRKSTRAAIMADELSREESTSSILERRISSLETLLHSPALKDWLANPAVDWDLPNALLAEVENQC